MASRNKASVETSCLGRDHSNPTPPGLDISPSLLLCLPRAIQCSFTDSKSQPNFHVQNERSHFKLYSWDSESFVSAYFNIPLIFILYFGYKWIKKSKVVRLEDMPIREYIEIARLNPEPPPHPKKGWRKLNFLWG